VAAVCVLLAVLLVAAVVESAAVLRRHKVRHYVREKLKKGGYEKPGVSYIRGRKNVASSLEFIEAAIRETRGNPPLDPSILQNPDIMGPIHQTCFYMQRDGKDDKDHLYWDLELAPNKALGICTPRSGDRNSLYQCKQPIVPITFSDPTPNNECYKGEGQDDTHPICKGWCVCVERSGDAGKGVCRCAQAITPGEEGSCTKSEWGATLDVNSMLQQVHIPPPSADAQPPAVGDGPPATDPGPPVAP